MATGSWVVVLVRHWVAEKSIFCVPATWVRAQHKRVVVVLLPPPQQCSALRSLIRAGAACDRNWDFYLADLDRSFDSFETASQYIKIVGQASEYSASSVDDFERTTPTDTSAAKSSTTTKNTSRKNNDTLQEECIDLDGEEEDSNPFDGVVMTQCVSQVDQREIEQAGTGMSNIPSPNVQHQYSSMNGPTGNISANTSTPRNSAQGVTMRRVTFECNEPPLHANQQNTEEAVPHTSGTTHRPVSNSPPQERVSTNSAHLAQTPMFSAYKLLSSGQGTPKMTTKRRITSNPKLTSKTKVKTAIKNKLNPKNKGKKKHNFLTSLPQGFSQGQFYYRDPAQPGPSAQMAMPYVTSNANRYPSSNSVGDSYLDPYGVFVPQTILHEGYAVRNPNVSTNSQKRDVPAVHARS